MGKNILIIHHSLGGGGAEKVLIDMLNNFDYEKYYVTLLIIENVDDRYSSQLSPNVNVLYVYDKRRPLFKKILSKLCLGSFYEKAELKKLLGDNSYHAIISWMEGPAVRYHGYLLDKTSNNISWVHADLKMNPWNRHYFVTHKEELDIYRRMNHISFVSQRAMNAFNEIYEVDKSREKVCLNSIDKIRIRKLSEEYLIPSKSTFQICSVGRLAPIKRYDRLIEACHILQKEGLDFEVKILGQGVLQKELESIIDDKRLTGKIQLCGYIPNPYPYIKSADLFVLTSDTEGYPTVLCESMSLGTPVLATNVTGSQDIIGENEEYGLLADLTPESVATKIKELIINKDILKKYTEKAIERSEIFSVEKSLSDIYGLIDNP